jgi:hypothetical protein
MIHKKKITFSLPAKAKLHYPPIIRRGSLEKPSVARHALAQSFARAKYLHAWTWTTVRLLGQMIGHQVNSNSD